MLPLNIVLLGAPAAGKSALLAALLDAAQTQPATLDAKVQDLTGELGKLQQASRDDKYQPTRTAITSYPIALEVDNGSERTVHLLDSGGAEARELLSAPEKLGKDAPLHKALASADGVLLVVDVSSTPQELEKQFLEFSDFLHDLQTRRSAETEVAGLPVFLVLSKCDRIAKKGESHAQWMQRIEEAKRRVSAQFQKLMSDVGSLAFGGIDLRVWATATRRPTETETTGRGQQPYQVGELFRQCFEAAEDFQRRRDRSYQLLHTSFMAIGALVFLLAAVLAWYGATRPSLDEAALDNRVQSLLAGTESSPVEQVREPLEDRLKELREIQKDDAFGSLPSSTRDRVRALERTIEDYQRLNRDYQAQVRNPRLAQREVELSRIEKALAEFDAAAARWPGTRLARRHDEWKTDAVAIRQALADEEAWIRAQIQEGEKLREEGGLVIANQVDATQRERWFARLHEYQLRGRRHKSTDRVPDTTIPYRSIYQFDRLDTAEREWRQFKDRLDKLRDEAMSGTKSGEK